MVRSFLLLGALGVVSAQMAPAVMMAQPVATSSFMPPDGELVEGEACNANRMVTMDPSSICKRPGMCKVTNFQTGAGECATPQEVEEDQECDYQFLLCKGKAMCKMAEPNSFQPMTSYPTGVCTVPTEVAVGDPCDYQFSVCPEGSICFRPRSFATTPFASQMQQAPALCSVPDPQPLGAACDFQLRPCKGDRDTVRCVLTGERNGAMVCTAVEKDLQAGQECDYEAKLCGKGLGCEFPNTPVMANTVKGTCYEYSTNVEEGAPCGSVRRCGEGLFCDIVDFTCTKPKGVPTGEVCEMNFGPADEAPSVSRYCEVDGDKCIIPMPDPTSFNPNVSVMPPLPTCQTVTMVDVDGGECSPDQYSATLVCGEGLACVPKETNGNGNGMVLPPIQLGGRRLAQIQPEPRGQPVPLMGTPAATMSGFPAFQQPRFECKTVTPVATGAACDYSLNPCAEETDVCEPKNLMGRRRLMGVVATMPAMPYGEFVCNTIEEVPTGGECGPQSKQCEDGSQCMGPRWTPDMSDEESQELMTQLPTCVAVKQVAEGETCNYYDVQCANGLYCASMDCPPDQPDCTKLNLCVDMGELMPYAVPVYAATSFAPGSEMGNALSAGQNGPAPTIAYDATRYAAATLGAAGDSCQKDSQCAAGLTCDCNGARRRLLFGGSKCECK